MKNLFLLFFMVIILASCSNNSDKKTPTYNEVNVKNVNGNIPDTTNAIDLSTKKVDSGSVVHDTSEHH
ncbi:MAG: hypothetical protein ABI359_11245 [Ginsengibacter sp.]